MNDAHTPISEIDGQVAHWSVLGDDTQAVLADAVGNPEFAVKVYRSGLKADTAITKGSVVYLSVEHAQANAPINLGETAVLSAVVKAENVAVDENTQFHYTGASMTGHKEV